MDISFDQFKEEVAALEIKIKAHFKNQEAKNEVLIMDGTVNKQAYYDADIKIMWILKEPYDEINCDWDITKNLLEDISSGKNKSASATWQPIIYSAYGILNNIATLDKIPKMYKSLTSSILDQIAFINVQKLTRKTKTDDLALKQYYEKNKEILFAQIKTYRPNIIIGGNTLHLFKADLQILAENELPMGHFSKDKILFIHAKHPAQTKIRRTEYVNAIILSANENRKVYK